MGKQVRPGVFVVKYGDSYLRFGSYSSVTRVEFPEQATVYRRKRDADFKLGSDRLWENNEEMTYLDLTKLVVVEVAFTSTETLCK